MLFLDLELYVPPDERKQSRSSLSVNPSRPKHLVLGGCFLSKRFDAEISSDTQIESHWLWKYDFSEPNLLRAIKSLFKREWEEQRKEGARILDKPIKDLVVCGAGVAKLDLPALYCRSLYHKIANPADLFEVFLKSRPIELSTAACFLFPDEPHLYPKTTTEIAERLGLIEEKGSSTQVWRWYEEKNFTAIEQRTAAELRTVMQIYQGLRAEIQKRRG